MKEKFQGNNLLIGHQEVIVAGRLPRVARLEAEYFEWVRDAGSFLHKLKTNRVRADVFTFMQGIAEREPKFNFHMEWDSIAAVPITTYENWWKKQINDKTRNMVRKAEKKGVELRSTQLTDEFVRGIEEIYNESPTRQGKPFKHYGKDFETLMRDHATFLDRSEFVGAYYQKELVGFIKLVHDDGAWHLMQIISKIAHRDKAPTNALIAKAVEICANNQIPYLHYGIWSRRGLGDFKKHHAFERLDLPRYFVPLTPLGKIILSLKLHRKISDQLPQELVDFLASLRRKWISRRQRSPAV